MGSVSGCPVELPQAYSAKLAAVLMRMSLCCLLDELKDRLPCGVASKQGGLPPKMVCDCPAELDQAKAAKLVAMLEASIQRRFPKGLKVHVHSVDRFGCLAALTRELKMAELTITRAKVKTYAINRSSGHTFYIMGAHGEP